MCTFPFTHFPSKPHQCHTHAPTRATEPTALHPDTSPAPISLSPAPGREQEAIHPRSESESLRGEAAHWPHIHSPHGKPLLRFSCTPSTACALQKCQWHLINVSKSLQSLQSCDFCFEKAPLGLEGEKNRKKMKAGKHLPNVPSPEDPSTLNKHGGDTSTPLRHRYLYV